MYFENKGVGQVLLGAPEEEPDSICSEVREGFRGGRKDRSGFAKEAEWGVAFQAENGLGEDRTGFKDNGKVEHWETG